MTDQHFLYHRPKRPLWQLDYPKGTTYNITYHPPKGMLRKEVIRRCDEIVDLIRTSFNRNHH
jgi:hypothetical protein